ncbi:glycosyltransferase involved in cell wall biosynthesis [Streptomyces sp. SAI-133]|uniref:glycosyltransferase n=1 Tax=unclassified Streptomyces TaxID=2593676 RepID=UPI002476A48D|nr:glycosyltransferase [Streptomyces sp. SAI-133]MDH6588681.1 glycosyltransferase involved in cell wall biosynthesis [Streptomyces sp. SAI-133]
MNRPLRVTVVTHAGVIGGAELWLLALLDATDRLDVDAVMLGPGPLDEQFRRRGIPCVTRSTGRTGVAVAASAVSLARRLRVNRPDVVLANGVKAACVCGPAAWLAGVRCVWAKHDYTHPRLMRLLAMLTDDCVATAEGLLLASRHPRAVLVPFPAPEGTALSREAAREELARHGARLAEGHDEPLLLTVSRLVSNKGVDDAIEALAKPGGERWRLAVVGEDAPTEPGERSRLSRLAADLGVRDRVDFTGWIHDAWRIIPGADVAAVLTKPTPSMPYPEGFGAVALEAMRSAVPVITTAGSPVAERVAQPGAANAGIAVPPGDSTEVALALRRLADRDTRAALGAVGRRLTAAHPGPAECAGRLAQVLSEAARLPGAGLTGTAPVSVVTTVLNEADVIDRLLGLLVPQLVEDGDEIVVVDGGSTDGTADRAEAWASKDARIRLLRLPGSGISAGRNVGVRAARNSLIACTDAGCDPGPDWLDRLRAAAAEPVPADLITGAYRVDGHRASARAMSAVGYPVPEEARRPGPWTRVYCRLFGRGLDATMPTGRSMAFSRAAWQDAGGFPEHLRTCEDVLFGRAVVGTGRRAVLASAAEVRWEQRPTLRGTAAMYFRYGEGGGQSADPHLVARDLARAFAYTTAVAAVVTGPRARSVAISAFAVYVSVPLTRVVRRRHWAALPLVPFAAVVRDLAKVAGAGRGLVRGTRADGPAADDPDTDGSP